MTMTNFFVKQKINYETVQPRHTAVPLTSKWHTTLLFSVLVYYFSRSYKCPASLLVAGLSRDQIPVLVRFSTTIQTSPGAHPASYKMGTRSFLCIKQQMNGANHLPPPSAEVKDKGQLYLYSSSVPLWQVKQ
jgi:hypothetical protein